MATAQPHYLLFSRTELTGNSVGRWHFVLESIDGNARIEAADEESGLRRERLELLAVVRGLEALDQPSRVTLVTSSERVTRGFRHGLDEWRSHQWCWERDGRWLPIKNRDLWQRVDRTLNFHRVECRTWRIRPHVVATPQSAAGGNRALDEPRPWSRFRQRICQIARPLIDWPAQLAHWGAAT